MPLTAGEVVQATVTAVRTFGIFFDCRGHEVLVLIPETSWTACYASCDQIAQPGDQFPVKILRPVDGREQYVGSMKAAFPDSDPWSGGWELRAGQTLQVRVVRRVEHADRCNGGPGYLLELRPAAYAMFCAADLTRLAVGDTCDVVVTAVNATGRFLRVELAA
jgi:hypothetical protein